MRIVGDNMYNTSCYEMVGIYGSLSEKSLVILKYIGKTYFQPLKPVPVVSIDLPGIYLWKRRTKSHSLGIFTSETVIG